MHLLRGVAEGVGLLRAIRWRPGDSHVWVAGDVQRQQDGWPRGLEVAEEQCLTSGAIGLEPGARLHRALDVEEQAVDGFVRELRAVGDGCLCHCILDHLGTHLCVIHTMIESVRGCESTRADAVEHTRT